jgi:hypothetical protein
MIAQKCSYTYQYRISIHVNKLVPKCNSTLNISAWTHGTSCNYKLMVHWAVQNGTGPFDILYNKNMDHSYVYTFHMILPFQLRLSPFNEYRPNYTRHPPPLCITHREYMQRIIKINQQYARYATRKRHAEDSAANKDSPCSRCCPHRNLVW